MSQIRDSIGTLLPGQAASFLCSRSGPEPILRANLSESIDGVNLKCTKTTGVRFHHADVKVPIILKCFGTKQQKIDLF
jgi:hypothetical protein